MKPGLKHFFLQKWVLLYLAMLLGIHGSALATTTLGTKVQKNKTIPRRLKQPASKTKTKIKSHPSQKTIPATPKAKAPKPSSLKKPKLLKPAKITNEDPLMCLDSLVVKQHIEQAPYVPFIQTIGMAVDYGRLAMNLFTKKAHRYAGSLSILFIKNIQFSGTFGYKELAQKRIMDNKSSCTIAGYYGSIGLDYFVFYDPRNNFYTGLRYGRSYFKNCTTPESPAEQVVNKDLTASWWELVIGSEHQIFSNFELYAGLIVHLKGLGRFEEFEPAPNYVVPGYGRNVQGTVPSFTLYIKYQISFLEKQIPPFN